MRESFFVKYNIKPEIDYKKLLVLFRTDPSKRRYASIVIQTIKSNKNLFAEELLTIHSNLTNNVLLTHKKLLDNINLLGEHFTLDNFKNFQKSFDLFFSMPSKENSFFYSTLIGSSEVLEEINNFKVEILEEICNKVNLELEGINNKLLIAVYNFFDNNDISYTKKIDNIISSKIEMIVEQGDNNNTNTLYYVKNLSEVASKRADIYASFKFLADQLIEKNKNKKFVNEYYVLILSMLNEKDRTKYLNSLFNIVDSYLDLTNAHKIAFKEISDVFNKLVENYAYVHPLLNTKNFDNNEFMIRVGCMGIIVKNGEEWWNKYCKTINELKKNPSKENIYKFVCILFDGKDIPHECYPVFANVIIEISNFNQDLAEFVQKRDTLSKLAKQDEKSLIYWSYSVIYDDPRYETIFLSPQFVDDFLCKYYVLHYLNDELFSDDMIENIQSALLIPLGMIDNFTDHFLAEQSPVDRTLTVRGAYIKSVLKQYPNDWIVSGKTCSRLLIDICGDYSGSLYGKSKFSDYKNKYNSLFNKRSTVSPTNYFITITQQLRKYKDIYNNAVSLFNNEQYVDAKREFLKVEEYSNSKEFLNVIDDRINEQKYNQAIKLCKIKELEKALTIFEELKDYKDSKSYVSNIKEQLCEKKYNLALKEHKKGNYENAKNLFAEILNYKDAKKYYNKCSEKLKLKIYNHAIELSNAGKFEEALKEFNKIKDYSDSKEKIVIINKYINYNEALCFLNVYEENKKNIYCLEKALAILSPLAKEKFLDAEKLYNSYSEILDNYNQRKRKKNIAIIVVSIILCFTLIIGIAVGASVDKNKRIRLQYDKQLSTLNSYIDNYSPSKDNEIRTLLNDLNLNNSETSDKYYYNKAIYYIDGFNNDYLIIENCLTYINSEELKSKCKNKYIDRVTDECSIILNDTSITADEIDDKMFIIDHYFSIIPDVEVMLYDVLIEKINKYDPEEDALIQKCIDYIPKNYRDIEYLTECFDLYSNKYKQMYEQVNDYIIHYTPGNNDKIESILNLLPNDYLEIGCLKNRYQGRKLSELITLYYRKNILDIDMVETLNNITNFDDLFYEDKSKYQNFIERLYAKLVDGVLSFNGKDVSDIELMFQIIPNNYESIPYYKQKYLLNKQKIDDDYNNLVDKVSNYTLNNDAVIEEIIENIDENYKQTKIYKNKYFNIKTLYYIEKYENEDYIDNKLTYYFDKITECDGNTYTRYFYCIENCYLRLIDGVNNYTGEIDDVIDRMIEFIPSNYKKINTYIEEYNNKKNQYKKEYDKLIGLIENNVNCDEEIILSLNNLPLIYKDVEIISNKFYSQKVDKIINENKIDENLKLYISKITNNYNQYEDLLKKYNTYINDKYEILLDYCANSYSTAKDVYKKYLKMFPENYKDSNTISYKMNFIDECKAFLKANTSKDNAESYRNKIHELIISVKNSEINWDIDGVLRDVNCSYFTLIFNVRWTNINGNGEYFEIVPNDQGGLSLYENCFYQFEKPEYDYIYFKSYDLTYYNKISLGRKLANGSIYYDEIGTFKNVKYDEINGITIEFKKYNTSVITFKIDKT